MNAFKRNLLAGYGVSLVLLISSALLSYKSINNLLRSAELVNHTNQISQKLEQVISTLKDAETGQRGFLITNDERFLDPYRGAHMSALSDVAEIKKLTIDNVDQQSDCDSLKTVVDIRMNYLAKLIDRQQRGEKVTDSMLIEGKKYMDNARRFVKKMQQREASFLVKRTADLNDFAAATPLYILLATLLAVAVTIVSLVRVLKDYNTRVALQNTLQQKDREISERLAIVDQIANQVSAGDYKIKVDDEGRDALGSIAGSLNKMAASLDESFTLLSEKEWLQTGIVSLNEIVIVEQDIETISKQVLNFLVAYCDSQAGVFYLLNDEGMLEMMAGYAVAPGFNHKLIARGEALAGQAAASGKWMLVNGIDANQYQISFLSGNVKATSVVAIPLFYNRQLLGVIELASLREFSSITKRLLETAALNIGIAINTAQSRRRVQELLEQTQAQTEELQAQHSELENINAELEAQAQRLQTSEEELKVQQEELQQANSELEERSSLLQQKNELILERNLEIQTKAEELTQSTRYKSEFLANMSHELRTPLNSILLLSKLLSDNRDGNLSADQIEYAKVIQSSGNGLLTLIDEILDLSKIEAGKMTLEFTDVPVNHVLQELQGLFVPVAQEKGIAFITQVTQGVSASIHTDRLRLEQILRNLISNALKFTRQGSVEVLVSEHKQHIRFTVKDTGIGIPAHKQETIFEAFQQADGSTRRQFGGTGLGLSISKELARLLGGEIELSSEEGKGSAFTLQLPIASKEAVANEIVLPAIPAATASQPGPVSQPYTPYLSTVIPMPVQDDRHSIVSTDKLILIIEDDTAFARSLLEYTRNKGYKGIIAVRGDEGVELAKQFLPVGILLDIQLPVKSGWQVMDELKADPHTRPIPVHMMSSHQAKTQSLMKGAIDFINKPVAFEKLGLMFAKIEQALTKHPKKVVIVEENSKHAQALAYFLQEHNIASEIRRSVQDCIQSLQQKEVECVILDMGIPNQHSYDTLEEVKKTPGLEHVPIIIFTGKNLSTSEAARIKQYAETIVIKTAHSYERILDEISLFLHLVEEQKKGGTSPRYKKMGDMAEVLQGKTVLIADDDVRNIFSLTRALEQYGMEVISAIDGKEALAHLQTGRKIDLVLMDMMMPEMDGYESTKQIRNLQQYGQLPIIAVTAKAMNGDREKCIEAGASDYITKPVDIDQLISLLRVWLYQNG